MATHDYVIANQSGAAFRTDLNNALAAIVSNNSNSSSPATTYAYQWWADTTSGTLKIRNSANNAWVELLQLDGTLTLEDGSVSTPALAFRDDLNTGIFSSAADTFNIATAGTERARIDSNGAFFIKSTGTSYNDFTGSSDAGLVIGSSANTNSGVMIRTSTSGTGRVNFGDGDGSSSDRSRGFIHYLHSSNALHLGANASTRMMLDSIGNVLIGSTTSIEVASSAEAQMQITQSSDGSRLGLALISIFNGSGPSAILTLGHGRGSTSGLLQDNDLIGEIRFGGGDGTDCQTIGARIVAEINGTPGSNAMPTDLIFSTNSGGASATERMRIRSSGGLCFAGEVDDAHTLDDYEEGTFTPDWKGGSALGTSITYGTTNAGSYTKIGRLVTVTARTDITGGSGALGFWFCTNMPFVVNSGGKGFNAVGSISLENNNFGDDVIDIVTTMEQNNNNMHIHGVRDNNPLSNSISPSNDYDFSLQFTITYQTA